MKVGQAIKQAMKATHTTQIQMKDRIGVKSQSVVSMRLSSDGVSISNVLEMLDAIGYELVIQPKRPGRRPEGQFVIDNKEE